MKAQKRSLPTLPPEVLELADHTVTCEDLVVEAAQINIARDLVHLVAHQEGTFAGEDSEPAHQMRVALRRARSVLGASQDLFRPTLLLSLDQGFRWLARRIARMREPD